MPTRPPTRRSPVARRPRPAEAPAGPGHSAGYSTREVAGVLGLSTATILSWTRAGLLEPERDARGQLHFSFQDIVTLRTARGLLDQAIPPRKVRAALESLRARLPVGRPLSAVHISALGQTVLVRDDHGVWEPSSGQLRIDFDASAEGRAEPLARPAVGAVADEDEMVADDWYDEALDLESTSPDRAVLAYRRALALDPRHADAHLNLGRLLHESGDLEAAEAHYRLAEQADPGEARARYNLGVVLEDLGRTDDAIAAYEGALALDAGLATAHFNLSRLREARGEEAEALGHLLAYKRLVSRG